jgi:hypothetical protein
MSDDGADGWHSIAIGDTVVECGPVPGGTRFRRHAAMSSASHSSVMSASANTAANVSPGWTTGSVRTN